MQDEHSKSFSFLHRRTIASLCGLPFIAHFGSLHEIFGLKLFDLVSFVLQQFQQAIFSG